jgi:hypothetical protein
VRGLSAARPIDAHQLDGSNAARIGCAVSNGVWSRMDAVTHVLGDGVDGAKLRSFLATEQIEAGRQLILNCATARALIDEWCAIALSRPTLFTDDESAVPNAPGFKEHRHDQSLFSALMFKYGLSGTSAWESVPATQLRTETIDWWRQQGSALS